jgi:predicted TIM-barrel fold metal-dependent hydrolase
VNDFNAQLIAHHGERFGVFATVPLPDVEGAIVEARRALGELGLDGVGLITQYLGRYLGDPAFEPLYRELDRQSAVVYVHPGPVPGAPPVACAGSEPFEDFVLEFVFDTTRTITSLVYAGVAQRYPNIRWIFSHGGGTIPFLAFRLAELHAYTPRFNQALPEGPMPSLRRFYYETAQAFSVAQLHATRALAAVDRLLFGTDYPPCTNLYSDQNRSLIRLPPMELPSNGDPAPTFDTVFTADERVQVERTNALNLFPRLAARLGGAQPLTKEQGHV